MPHSRGAVVRASATSPLISRAGFAARAPFLERADPHPCREGSADRKILAATGFPRKEQRISEA